MPIFTPDGDRFGLHIGGGAPPDERARVQLRDPILAMDDRGPVAERVPGHVEAILDHIGIEDRGRGRGPVGSGQSGRNRGRGPSGEGGGGGHPGRGPPRSIGRGAGAADGRGIDVWEWQAREEAARQTGTMPLEIGIGRRGRGNQPGVEYHGATRGQGQGNQSGK